MRAAWEAQEESTVNIPVQTVDLHASIP
jgi:hypothetical protein